MTSRKITQVVSALEVTEGAGVSVFRSIGTLARRNLDPFLMLDQRYSSDSYAYGTEPNDFLVCKRSSNPPFCDGSHKAIPQEDLDADQGLETVWFKVAEPNALQAGEVRSVQAGSKTIALTYFNDEYGALDHACPHQGGPLSEGTIECEGDECWLRCPWHGWDFHPLSGKSPSGFDDGVDTHPVEVRDDGVYVQVEERKVWQTSLHNPAFADFANNCGSLGIRVEKPDQLEAALRKAIVHKGPALVEIISDPELI